MAMRSTHEHLEYGEILSQDPVMAENFTAQEIAELLDPGTYTGLCAVLADELADRVLERSHG
ncbi:hypothetical protein D3C75_1270280 [compost metagenome]